MFGGLGGQRRVLGLFAGLLGGFQQLQHAQHAVHRGAKLVAHHRQEVGLRPVRLLRFLAGADQLADRLFLFPARAVQPAGEIVDVTGQVADLAVVEDRQAGLVVAALDRLDRLAHGTDRRRQALRQAARDEEGEDQGEGGQQGGLQEDFLLPLAEGVVGHADHHPAEVVLAGLAVAFAGAVQQRVAGQGDALALDGGVEDVDRRGVLQRAGQLFDVHQDIVVAVAYLDEAHMRGVEGGLQQLLQHGRVAGDHAVFGGRRQLVGDQLAGMGQFLAQVLQARVGEVGGEQQGQQQRRAQANRQHAGTDVPAVALAHGSSPSARRRPRSASLARSIPRERATCRLPSTLKCPG